MLVKCPPEQIEEWYDETYQMCLLAFLEIEQYERKRSLMC